MRLFASYFFCLVFFSSCSYYRFHKDPNPFAQFGIKRLTVPYFWNRSTLPHAGKEFTKEFALTLGTFRDLQIDLPLENTGVNANSDAVLVGILTSPDKVQDNLQVMNRRFVDARVLDNRPRFLVPSVNRMRMTLQLVLIKNPQSEDLLDLENSLTNPERKNPRVIFSESMNLEVDVNRVDLTLGKSLDLGQVNMTQSLGAQDQAMQALARQAVNQFKEMILYAY